MLGCPHSLSAKLTAMGGAANSSCSPGEASLVPVTDGEGPHLRPQHHEQQGDWGGGAKGRTACPQWGPGTTVTLAVTSTAPHAHHTYGSCCVL